MAVVVGVWDIVWKLVALQRAFRNRQWGWVVPLLTVSSAGLLPIWYLLRYANPETAAGDE
jgi:hypothetical protein